MLCMLKSCVRCNGDLVLDDADWKCVQCAQYYYKEPVNPIEEKLSASELEFASVHLADPHYGSEGPRRSRREGFGSRSTRRINLMIEAKITWDAKWWDRNRQIIEYLDQGLSVREVSRLTVRGQRQIRAVRERLAGLREAA